MGFYFLASPYSVDNATPKKMEERFQEAIDAVFILMQSGKIVFSPIIHSHPIAVKHHLMREHEFWHPTNRTMIEESDGVIVLDTDSAWTRSVGIKAELQHAREHDKPILYFSDFYLA